MLSMRNIAYFLVEEWFPILILTAVLKPLNKHILILITTLNFGVFTGRGGNQSTNT